MTKPKDIVLPKGDIQKAAGAYIYTHGSCTEVELFLAVNFGATMSARRDALQRAITGGWLIETERGTIACSQAALDYYDAQEDKPEEKYVGQIVPAATRDVFSGTGLSKKYLTNSRGMRQDVPAWSVRENVTFYTKA
jgi:hypothetical protein